MRYLLLALRLLLGSVFIYAAYLKLREPWLMFAMQIDAYQLLPQWAVLSVARTLPWAEMVVGLALITGLGLRYAAAGLFFGIMTFTFLKGLQIDCGCFGPGETIGPKTLARDATLLLMCATLWILSSRVTKRAENQVQFA